MPEAQNSIILPESLSDEVRQQIEAFESVSPISITGEQFFKAVDLLGENASAADLISLIKICQKNANGSHNNGSDNFGIDNNANS